MSFHKMTSEERPTITLEVVGPVTFRLVEGFRYRDEFEPSERVTVHPHETDLASVPFFLQWLVRSYGRHTMAALVHDELWESTSTIPQLRRANRLFRHAMWELGVAWARRWLMWAAVTLGMLTRKWPGRLVLGVWAVALVAAGGTIAAANGTMLSWSRMWVVVGIAAVVAAVAAAVAVKTKGDDGPLASFGRWGRIAAACVAGLAVVATAVAHVDLAVRNPAATTVVALLVGVGAWGRSAGAGVIATGAFVILGAPILGVLVGLVLYEVFELVAFAVIGAGRRGKRIADKAPTGPLNPPARARLYID
jgi:hypothetical protein